MRSPLRFIIGLRHDGNARVEVDGISFEVSVIAYIHIIKGMQPFEYGLPALPCLTPIKPWYYRNRTNGTPFLFPSL